MKLVVDTNIILSSLIKNGFTRNILKNINIKLFVPAFSLSEIMKYENYICKKASINNKEFKNILKTIFEDIEIIPQEFYKEFLEKSKKLIEDVDDVVFLACAFYLKADIWSDDKHFQQQNKIKILTTKELAKKFLR